MEWKEQRKWKEREVDKEEGRSVILEGYRSILKLFIRIDICVCSILKDKRSKGYRTQKEKNPPYIHLDCY
jgi:hypothetical protein